MGNLFSVSHLVLTPGAGGVPEIQSQPELDVQNHLPNSAPTGSAGKTGLQRCFFPFGLTTSPQLLFAARLRARAMSDP